MKAYRFSLEAVLRIRDLEERIARDRLVVAQRNLRRAQDSCAELEAAMSELSFPNGPSQMGTVHWITDQAQRLSEEIRVSRELLMVATHERDEASGAWHRARKRVGALEKLNVQGLARWREESAREEVAELDDLASVRHFQIGVRA